MNAQDFDRNLYITAATAAGLEHRKNGGTGAAPDELIDRHLAELRFDLNAEERRATPVVASTPAPSTPAPSLLDGGGVKQFRTLRGIDGREHPVFGRGERLADRMNRAQDGLTIEGLGNALAAMAAGESYRYRDEVRALSEGLNTAGGVMVADELSAQMIDLARAKSVIFEAGAQVVSMNSETLTLARLKSDNTVAITAEGASITPSDATFDSILLNAKKLASLTSASNELLADAANAGQVITDSLAASMALAIDDYVLDVLFNSTQIGTESSVGSIGYADLLKARYDIQALNGLADVIICNPALPYDLSLLTEGGTNAFMAPPSQLADLRYLTTTACTDDHALVGDFSRCIVGLRKNIELRISGDAGLETDSTFFRCIARLDANVSHNHFRILAGIS